MNRLSQESLARIEQARDADVQLQCIRTARRPLRTLPASWREPGVAEYMAEWIGRFGTEVQPVNTNWK